MMKIGRAGQVARYFQNIFEKYPGLSGTTV
jgi:hypothetical protein